MWMWSMLICMMQLCFLQVTSIIDASDENAYLILQPNHVSNVAKMQPSYVQDMFVNNAAVNLLRCLQVNTVLDVAVERGETGYEFRRDDDDYVSCSISNMW